MFKRILTSFVILVTLLIFTRSAFAATSVRLEQPKSPTNQNNFNLVFVTLNTDNAAVTVTCWKQGPGEVSMTQFASVPLSINGGNSGNCPIDSSVVSANGTYTFQVQANGTPSNIVTVDYNTNGPGTPGNYSKNQPSSCQYSITFRTANDSGETTKVELYRSTNTSFSADSGTRVQSTGIGSNTDGSFTDTVGDCGKTYYYAVRAFDGAGNGSGVVGDSETHVTNPTTTTQGTTNSNLSPAPTSGGAIPVVTSGVKEVQGAAISPAPTDEQGVLGAATTPTKAPAMKKTESNFLSTSTILGVFVTLILLAFIVWLWKRRAR